MKTLTTSRAFALVLCAAGFAQDMQGMQHNGMEMKATPATKAIAVLMPAANNPVRGTVTFEKVDGGVKITAHITGLTPGKHGFHVHEYGDCSAPDFTSAGPHFMAPGESHGAPTDSTSHQGDMGNLVADADGVAHLEWVDPHMSLDGPHSILGRSVILHEKEDDLTTQPTGNSGGRIACGVIGLAKP
jgi:Cu-Zn family superoxide dismutase